MNGNLPDISCGLQTSGLGANRNTVWMCPTVRTDAFRAVSDARIHDRV